MPHKRLRPRYLVTIRGRDYWQPSSELRAEGWKTKRLLPENGDVWLQAEAINREVDLWRAGIQSPSGKPVKGTVAWLIEQYLASEEFAELATKTRIGYRSDAKLLKELGPEGQKTFGADLITSIDATVVQTVKKALKPRGLYAANAIMRTARLIWSWGVRTGLVKANPWKAHRRFKVQPRQQIWLAPQREAFKAAAIAAGWPSVALALDLAIYTVQRRADVVRMSRAHYQGGLLRIRQQKTGRVVHVPPPAPLRAILDGLPANQELFLLDEPRPDASDAMPRPRQPYSSDLLTKRFRAVLTKLAQDDPDGGWSELQLRDTRRTSIVALAEADCTIPQITALSGHDTDECQRIIDTYLPRTEAMAKAAVKKWNRHILLANQIDYKIDVL